MGAFNMRSQLLAATIIAGALIVPGLAMAQEATGTAAETPTATDMQQADVEFATKAAAAGEAEVALAKVGIDKATDPEVKAFADRLIQDHTKANDQLTQIMQAKSMEMPAADPAEAKAEHDRITALSGTEFDREFMMHWVSSHEKGIELYSSEAEAGKDAELKQFAADTVPTLREHLDEAKRIESSLQQVAGTEQAPEQQTEPAAGAAATGAATAEGTAAESTTEQPATTGSTTAESTTEQPATGSTTPESTMEQPPATTGGTTAEGTAEPTATSAESTAEQPTATQEAARPPYPLGDKTANDLIGQSVVNQNGDNVGEIYDIVLNPSDQAVLAVVSVGGFLGLGEKNVAVPFEQLQPGENETILMSTATEGELKALPEYDEAAGYTAAPRDRAIGDGAQ
jgi:putative membrane protein